MVQLVMSFTVICGLKVLSHRIPRSGAARHGTAPCVADFTPDAALYGIVRRRMATYRTVPRERRLIQLTCSPACCPSHIRANTRSTSLMYPSSFWLMSSNSSSASFAVAAAAAGGGGLSSSSSVIYTSFS